MSDLLNMAGKSLIVDQIVEAGKTKSVSAITRNTQAIANTKNVGKSTLDVAGLTQRISDVASDNALTDGEKAQLKKEWASIQYAYTSYATQATDLGITSNVNYTNYVSAFNALKDTKINTAQTKDLEDILAEAGTSEIVGATLTSLFSTYYNKENALRTVIFEGSFVASTERQYVLSENGTSPATGEDWSSAIPTVTASVPYSLYRERMVYKDASVSSWSPSSSPYPVWEKYTEADLPVFIGAVGTVPTASDYKNGDYFVLTEDVAGSPTYIKGTAWILQGGSWVILQDVDKLLVCLSALESYCSATGTSMSELDSEVYTWFRNIVADTVFASAVKASSGFFENIEVAGDSIFRGTLLHEYLETQKASTGTTLNYLNATKYYKRPTAINSIKGLIEGISEQQIGRKGDYSFAGYYVAGSFTLDNVVYGGFVVPSRIVKISQGTIFPPGTTPACGVTVQDYFTGMGYSGATFSIPSNSLVITKSYTPSDEYFLYSDSEHLVSYTVSGVTKSSANGDFGDYLEKDATMLTFLSGIETNKVLKIASGSANVKDTSFSAPFYITKSTNQLFFSSGDGNKTIDLSGSYVEAFSFTSAVVSAGINGIITGDIEPVSNNNTIGLNLSYNLIKATNGNFGGVALDSTVFRATPSSNSTGNWNGHATLANGLKVNFGRYNYGTAPAIVNFDSAFDTVCYGVLVSMITLSSASYGRGLYVQSVSTTSFTCKSRDSSIDKDFYYLAYGY